MDAKSAAGANEIAFGGLGNAMDDGADALMLGGQEAAGFVKIVGGNFLNKLEIMINFIQIYGLILILDVDIEWPQVTEDAHTCTVVAADGLTPRHLFVLGLFGLFFVGASVDARYREHMES